MQRTRCTFCTIPIQEQGANYRAKQKTTTSLESQAGEQRKLSELIVNTNYIKQPADAPDDNLTVAFRPSTSESSMNGTGSVLVHGR